MATKQKHPELKVVFDTNALYTKSESDLLNNATARLIADYSNVTDLTVTWFLPRTVVWEREYQMKDRAFGLLPTIEKLEKLLGHKLSITKEIIHSRVKDTIQKQISALRLNIIDLDVESVDWELIITNSLFRNPPFEKGDKEKGFRDSLVAESFLQLVEESPSTARYCRLVLLTRDGLLMDHLRARTKNNKNVKFLLDISDLKTLINTLASQVTEALIEKVLPKAAMYFFELNVKTSLFYQEKLEDAINNKFKDKLSEVCEGADFRENGTWYVYRPQFISKSGQRITWSTAINVVSKCLKYKRTSPAIPSEGPPTFFPAQYTLPSGSSGLFSGAQYTLPSGSSGLFSGAQYTLPSGSSGLLGGISGEKLELVADGRTTFEVTWSVLVSTNLKLRNAKIENISFLEIDWTDKIED